MGAGFCHRGSCSRSLSFSLSPIKSSAQGSPVPISGRAVFELQRRQTMEPPGRKEKPKVKEPVSRVEKARQKSAQQELKQRQRAEIYALNRVMTELEQQQFDEFCKQMQPPRE